MEVFPHKNYNADFSCKISRADKFSTTQLELTATSRDGEQLYEAGAASYGIMKIMQMRTKL